MSNGGLCARVCAGSMRVCPFVSAAGFWGRLHRSVERQRQVRAGAVGVHCPEIEARVAVTPNAIVLSRGQERGAAHSHGYKS